MRFDIDLPYRYNKSKRELELEILLYNREANGCPWCHVTGRDMYWRGMVRGHMFHLDRRENEGDNAIWIHIRCMFGKKSGY